MTGPLLLCLTAPPLQPASAYPWLYEAPRTSVPIAVDGLLGGGGWAMAPCKEELVELIGRESRTPSPRYIALPTVR